MSRAKTSLTALCLVLGACASAPDPEAKAQADLARAIEDAPKYSKDESIIINLSGRGDKDIFTIADAFDDKQWTEYIKNKAQEYIDNE